MSASDSSSSDTSSLLPTLPEEVIGKLYETLSPGTPERLRLACKNFDKIYVKVEGKLPLNPVENSKLTISVYVDKEMNVKLESNSSPRTFCLELDNPEFQRFLHFLRIAKVLYFNNLEEWPELLDSPKRVAIVKDVLAKQSYDKVVINNSPTIIGKILDLFRTKQTFQLFASTYSLEIIDIPTLERITLLECKMKLQEELMKKVSKYLTPRSLRVQSNEHYRISEYMMDWEDY